MIRYLINKNTLAIIPYGKKSSMVYEKDNILFVKISPQRIINYNCLYYGSSYQGRLKSTEAITGFTYKLPIIIEEYNNLIFFPTTSNRNKDCSWINLYSINKAEINSLNNKTKVKFINNKSLDLNISLNILKNQIYRASVLDNKLRRNKYQNS